MLFMMKVKILCLITHTAIGIAMDGASQTPQSTPSNSLELASPESQTLCVLKFWVFA